MSNTPNKEANESTPFGGLSYKEWLTFARNHLDIMKLTVSGAESIHHGWFYSGISPFEAAEMAFNNDLDASEAQEQEEIKLAASIKPFNILESIIEDAQNWTMSKDQVKEFRTWLEAVEYELAKLTEKRLLTPEKWNYIYDYEEKFDPKQTAARIYASITNL